MHSRFKQILFSLVILGCGALTPVVFSQITPHSALKNFKLPKYNETSSGAYTLSGKEGIYREDGLFEVISATLSLYSGDEKQILETTILSDAAIIDLESDIASGPSYVEIKNEDFFLRGEDWTLDMEKKRITIEKKGVIRFYQNVDINLEGIF